MIYDVAIIGGGASGMVAGIFARRRKKSVIILEKNARLGKKILLTGNGRCNISNKNVSNLQTIHKKYYGHNPKFVISVFSKFGFLDTHKFFEELGIKFKEEDKGRMFPTSNEAQSVVDVLEYELQKLHTKIKLKTSVKNLIFNKNRFEIETNTGEMVLSKKVIIATGGKTYPIMGTVGDGYKWATLFGHQVYEQIPSYSGLITKHEICQKLQGVKTKVEVKIFEDTKSQKPFIKNYGTIMFAHFGLSAPVVLEVSRFVAEKIYLENKKPILSINLFADYTYHELEKLLLKRWQDQPKKSLSNSFIGLLPKKVAPAFLQAQQIDTNLTVSEISKNLRKKIIQALTQSKFQITDVKGWEIAHFTAGGISTKEINPTNMQSKLQKNLFLTGEILDIDGQCGGYNLQFAWSTGAIAGMSV